MLLSPGYRNSQAVFSELVFSVNVNVASKSPLKANGVPTLPFPYILQPFVFS